MSKVSAIIPAFNCTDKLDDTLATLLAQTRPFDEIIVVDDGSNEPITSTRQVKIVRIDRKSLYRGSSAAKNHGARLATGDLLVFSDADILHAPDALESCLRRHQELGERSLINVYSIPLNPDSLKTCDWRAGDPRSMGRLRECVNLPDEHKRYFCTEQHFGLISKDYFLSLGGYDEHTYKDWGLNNQDLCYRVMKNGGKLTSEIRDTHGNRLVCFHRYGEHHNGAAAADVFKRKYGFDFSVDKLMVGFQ